MTIDGLLLVDKPEDCTSHDVVYKVRKILKTKKVGHAGTLDPFATGLLVLGIGKATRLLEYYKDMGKTYVVEMQLGTITDTADRTGQIMETRDFSSLDEETIIEAISSFQGTYKQVPPAYSAKKYNGERLYKLARQGKIINLPPKEVNISSIIDIEVDAEKGTAKFTATVSSGTYIRSLVTDIGYKLGCGATTTYLRRTSTGGFEVSRAFEIDDINTDSLMDITEATSFMPTILLNSEETARVLNGGQVHADGIAGLDGTFEKDEIVRILSDSEKLIAVANAERTQPFVKTLMRKNSHERVAKLVKVFGA